MRTEKYMLELAVSSGGATTARTRSASFSGRGGTRGNDYHDTQFDSDDEDVYDEEEKGGRNHFTHASIYDGGGEGRYSEGRATHRNNSAQYSSDKQLIGKALAKEAELWRLKKQRLDAMQRRDSSQRWNTDGDRSGNEMTSPRLSYKAQPQLQQQHRTVSAKEPPSQLHHSISHSGQQQNHDQDAHDDHHYKKRSSTYTPDSSITTKKRSSTYTPDSSMTTYIPRPNGGDADSLSDVTHSGDDYSAEEDRIGGKPRSTHKSSSNDENGRHQPRGHGGPAAAPAVALASNQGFNTYLKDSSPRDVLARAKQLVAEHAVLVSIFDPSADFSGSDPTSAKVKGKNNKRNCISAAYSALLASIAAQEKQFSFELVGVLQRQCTSLQQANQHMKQVLSGAVTSATINTTGAVGGAGQGASSAAPPPLHTTGASSAPRLYHYRHEHDHTFAAGNPPSAPAAAAERGAASIPISPFTLPAAPLAPRPPMGPAAEAVRKKTAED